MRCDDRRQRNDVDLTVKEEERGVVIDLNVPVAVTRVEVDKINSQQMTSCRSENCRSDQSFSITA